MDQIYTYMKTINGQEVPTFRSWDIITAAQYRIQPSSYNLEYVQKAGLQQGIDYVTEWHQQPGRLREKLSRLDYIKPAASWKLIELAKGVKKERLLRILGPVIADPCTYLSHDREVIVEPEVQVESMPYLTGSYDPLTNTWQAESIIIEGTYGPIQIEAVPDDVWDTTIVEEPRFRPINKAVAYARTFKELHPEESDDTAIFVGIACQADEVDKVIQQKEAMTTALQLLQYNDKPVRVGFDESHKPLWIAADVGEILGIANVRQNLAGFPEDEKGVCTVYTPGGLQQLQAVTEPGLYRLIFGSRKPEAEGFRRFVFHEVLPALNQTGSYSVGTEVTPLNETAVANLIAQSQQGTLMVLERMDQHRQESELRYAQAEDRYTQLVDSYRQLVEQVVGLAQKTIERGAPEPKPKVNRVPGLRELYHIALDHCRKTTPMERKELYALCKATAKEHNRPWEETRKPGVSFPIYWTIPEVVIHSAKKLGLLSNN